MKRHCSVVCLERESNADFLCCEPNALSTVHYTTDRLVVSQVLRVSSSSTADVDVAVDVESLRLDAELKDAVGSRSYTSLITVAHHSPKGRHLQVSTSTRNPKVNSCFCITYSHKNSFTDRSTTYTVCERKK